MAKYILDVVAAFEDGFLESHAGLLRGEVAEVVEANLDTGEVSVKLPKSLNPDKIYKVLTKHLFPTTASAPDVDIEEFN